MLSDGDRAAVNQTVMQELSELRESLDLTKAELRAAVDATDDWIDLNAAVYNLALPQPARSVLTAAQKLRLFKAVADRRFSSGG